MLSVIAYGRNDSHGTNLSKRAALSINALASVLTSENDEIIFVDYNTADDLPTYPETVADTLTDWAKKLLKVIRVRPSFHAQYKPFTDMVVIESIARNIAVRRVNNDCRWLLFTNTDIIVETGSKDRSLNHIVERLEEGLYHTPRFELPESLWESFNRSKPEEFRSILRQHAAAFGLDVPVMGPADIIYDYCGDFQLVELNLFKQIEGFDETMLLKGWCDPNIARRLQKLGYPARSLAHEVKSYHCGHHRGFEAPNRKKRGGPSKNDAEIYFYGLDEIVPRHQPTNWGALGSSFESFNLEERKSFGKLLSFNTSRPIQSTQAVEYPPSFRNSLLYQSEAVLPFVADLLWHVDPTAKITLISQNSVFDQVFSSLCGNLGIKFDITQAHANPDTALTHAASAETIVVNFGLDHENSDELSDQQIQDTLEPMEAVIAPLIEQENQRLARGHSHRKFIFINAERALRLGKTYQNQLWFYSKLAPSFHIAIVPLQSRVSYGYLKTPSASFDIMSLSLSASETYIPDNYTELMKTFSLVRYLCSRIEAIGKEAVSLEYLKPHLLAVVDRLLELDHCPLSKKQLYLIKKLGDSGKASTRLGNKLAVPVSTKRQKTYTSQLASMSSWNDPDWQLWAQAFGGEGNTNSLYARNAQIWAQIQVLYTLNKHGLLNQGRKINLNAEDCPRMSAVISQKTGRLTKIIDITTVASSDQANLSDASVSFMHPTKDWGAATFAPYLFNLLQCTNQQGLVVIACDVRVTDSSKPNCPNGRFLANGKLADLLQRHCSVSLVDRGSFEVEAETLDFYSRLNHSPASPCMITEFPGGSIVTSALTAWKQKSPASIEAWGDVQLSILALEEGINYFYRSSDQDSQLESRGIPFFPGTYRMKMSKPAVIDLEVDIQSQSDTISKLATTADQGTYSLDFQVSQTGSSSWTSAAFIISSTSGIELEDLRVEFLRLAPPGGANAS